MMAGLINVIPDGSHANLSISNIESPIWEGLSVASKSTTRGAFSNSDPKKYRAHHKLLTASGLLDLRNLRHAMRV
jgi:hypothetical protein